ncbi:hypothetical protein [Methanoculleus sp.]|uniref:hypothetical protein n=1 Tax=Methanoculleus sp. TaxID=90427 RepID=UPI0025EBFEB6|nr:hypothetical protein [Methanoculleus sp.]MCK9319830.1 hypothetical protein [Methanoculleus sp.]
MNTPYSEIYELFQNRIIRDTTFFIQNAEPTEIQKVAEERMFQLLKQAISEILLIPDKKNFEINLLDRDDENLEFLFELIEIEKQILADFMFELYASEDYITRWQALKQRYFTDDEIKIVLNSPANSLREFTNSIALLKNDNRKKVKMYLRRSRDTWKYKPQNYNPSVEG